MNITIQRLNPVPLEHEAHVLRLAHWLQIAATGRKSSPLGYIYLAQAHAIAGQRQLGRELAKSLCATMEEYA